MITSSRHRNFHLLPNVITTSSLFMGVVAFIHVVHVNFSLAAISIMVCVVLDGLDGRIARLTNNVSAFGGQFDSLTDVLVFGFLPGVIVSAWFFEITHVSIDSYMGKAVWLLVFFYTLSTAFRLAHFNSSETTVQKAYFRGLPCPAAALLLMAWVYFVEDTGVQTYYYAWISVVAMGMTSVLMACKFPYFSFKEIPLRTRLHRVMAIFIVASFLGMVYIDFAKFLLFIAVSYTLSAPALYYLRPAKWNFRSGKSL